MVPLVCELWSLQIHCRLDFDLKLASDACGVVREGRVVAATTHKKRSSLLYPMISNRPGSNHDIMEIFVKQIGTDFVTLEFLNIHEPGTDFKDVFTSKS